MFSDSTHFFDINDNQIYLALQKRKVPLGADGKEDNKSPTTVSKTPWRADTPSANEVIQN